MDTTYPLIGMLFAIFLIGTLNDAKQKEQIKKMQNQIDDLCKLIDIKNLYPRIYLRRKKS
ncbi:hypothetical protein ACVRW4_06685 [Streptococcus phocae subsp. phocae]|uniref:hypothetical protein n=1 Tax=Streptococcus phocae TaxID=119224 RepID=UPI000AE6B0D3|nr:hypothetical protein [Streptococcus phocae]